MKTLGELKDYLNKTDNAILILGSNATNNPLSCLDEKDAELLNEVYTNKSLRRSNDKFWKTFENLFGDKLGEEPTDSVFYAKELLNEGIVKKIYYQDIDNTFLDDENIIEIKGSINKFICTNPSCKEEYKYETLPKETGYKCVRCGKVIRPTYLMSGENYDIEMTKQFKKDIQDTNVLILVGLDLTEEYLVEMVSYYDERRYKESSRIEEKLKNNTIITSKERLDLDKQLVAIHNEDKSEVDYNEYFKCNFQALGDIDDSIKRFYNGIK